MIGKISKHFLRYNITTPKEYENILKLNKMINGKDYDINHSIPISGEVRLVDH